MFTIFAAKIMISVQITSFFSRNSTKRIFSGYEVFPVKGLDGKTCFYCPDCIVENIEWCDNCGEPFEIDPNNPKKICNDCAGGLLECHSTSEKLKNNLMSL